MSYDKSRSAVLIAVLLFYIFGMVFGLGLGWFIWAVRPFT